MLFDGICNLQAVAVDASRGNYGNCENYGKKLGRHEIPRGFARAQWRGADSITSAASPRAIKQP